MLRLALLAACTIAGSTVFATALRAPSAYRVPGTSYLKYLPVQGGAAQRPLLDQTDFSTPASSAVNWGQPLPEAVVWENYDVLLERFKKVRNLRWMKTVDQPDFARRISWLYPDDGCYARAGLVVFNLAQWLVKLPNKAFAFGNLTVKTPNALNGEVSWWYHVVPVVQIDKQKYVLDPTIDPLQPMKLEDWVGAMSPDPSSVQVAICGSGSYSPDDLCNKESDGAEAMAMNDQNSFLYSEWSRLLELKRVPEAELGDNPPWN